MLRKGYIKTEEHRKNLSIALKGNKNGKSNKNKHIWKDKPHPRGALGMKHTEEWKNNQRIRMEGKNNYWYGKHLTKEIIQKRKETLLKRYGTLVPSGAFKKGRIVSKEERIQISLRMKGKHYGQEFKKGHILTQGKKHPAFNNWSSREPYGIDFSPELKESIRKKFKRKCIECNQSEEELGYKLSIHHIDLNKQNNKENNLIPLCKSCHSQTNFNKINWINYFQNKIILNGGDK